MDRNQELSLPPPQRRYPSKLFVETTTRCNLGCIMCPKQADGCGIAEGDLPLEMFSRLEPAFPHLDALILNGIGEPLLTPHLETFIGRAKKFMPATSWIGFQSNGLLLTNLRAISLVQAGLDRVCLSIDAASPDTFSKIREGGELADLEHAFAALVAAKDRCNRPDFRIGIEFVLMGNNCDQLPDALRWAADQGASFAIVTHVLPYDADHMGEAAYGTCTAGAVDLFASYRERALREGLDIYRYFTARWKYARSTEEQRLIELVAELRREAEQRGLFVDMKKLLGLNLLQEAHISGVYSEARDVAHQRGMDLQLPEVHLTDHPSCRFVEEGSAFVSWDGMISPCYFLWHRYRCFAGGWEQQVTPRVFGNLQDRDIMDIWNDPAFLSFREHVTGYSYADCASCTLAPCDYVQTDDFSHDCHIKEVPCGACLWSRGIFQCLH